MGIDVPVPSGILFYGNGDKLSMNKWLLSKPGFRIEYFNHNQNNPMSTLSKKMEEARIAPKIFDNTKQRTILSIENLDDMLIEPDNINDVKLIGRFKNIMEDLADNNKHLTVATIINKPIDELEQAAIVPHRFGVQLEMKSFISKKELDELKNLNDYIELLEKKSDDDLINRLYTDKRFQFVADQEGTR